MSADTKRPGTTWKDRIGEPTASGYHIGDRVRKTHGAPGSPSDLGTVVGHCHGPHSDECIRVLRDGRVQAERWYVEYWELMVGWSDESRDAQVLGLAAGEKHEQPDSQR